MATLLVENVPPSHPFDAIAVDIERKYEGIVNVVRERKRTLLTRLLEFRQEYDSLLSNRNKTERELKSAKEHIEKFMENDLKTLQEVLFDKIEEKMEKLRISTANYFIHFECVSEELESKLSRLGKLLRTDYKLPNYSGMDTPVVAVGNRGKGKNEFDEPRGIAFDEETQSIYVCDIGNSCVKILSVEGEFIREFGFDELNRPWGILLCEDSIYVTDRGHCAIFQFHKNTYQLIKRVGKKGSEKGEFDYPRPLAQGPDGDLYVAEDNNNRISVFDRNLNFKLSIQHKFISSHLDVKFTKNNMLILSLESPNRVHLLTLQGIYVKSIITFDSEAFSCFFCIDSANNILLSICNKNLVQVYNEEGELLHTIGKGWLGFPFGLITTRSGKLIVVSDLNGHPLQIF